MKEEVNLQNRKRLLKSFHCLAITSIDSLEVDELSSIQGGWSHEIIYSIGSLLLAATTFVSIGIWKPNLLCCFKRDHPHTKSSFFMQPEVSPRLSALPLASQAPAEVHPNKSRQVIGYNPLGSEFYNGIPGEVVRFSPNDGPSTPHYGINEARDFLKVYVWEYTTLDKSKVAYIGHKEPADGYLPTNRVYYISSYREVFEIKHDSNELRQVYFDIKDVDNSYIVGYHGKPSAKYGGMTGYIYRHVENHPSENGLYKAKDFLKTTIWCGGPANTKEIMVSYIGDHPPAIIEGYVWKESKPCYISAKGRPYLFNYACHSYVVSLQYKKLNELHRLADSVEGHNKWFDAEVKKPFGGHPIPKNPDRSGALLAIDSDDVLAIPLEYWTDSDRREVYFGDDPPLGFQKITPPGGYYQWQFHKYYILRDGSVATRGGFDLLYQREGKRTKEEMNAETLKRLEEKEKNNPFHL